MDIIVLDEDREEIEIIDTYKSFIWTDRYNGYGDFELYTAMTDTILDTIRLNRYLTIRQSEHVMIIETINIQSDAEDGNHITVTGRSLESILDRRIVWGTQTVNGSLQNGVESLFNNSFIKPTDSSRKIDDFVFVHSDNADINALELEVQYTGTNLYSIVTKLCEEHGIGFQVTLTDTKGFAFQFYKGVDRSYEQDELPYVVFSPNFENIINSKYIESNSAFKNITLVGGEGEGSDRTYATVGAGTGLLRRELFTDARDLSSDLGDGQSLTESAYTQLLQQRGKEKLTEKIEVIAFEGQVETGQLFQYGVDFFDGDIVQIADAYGHETKSRIIELVLSFNETGTSIFPTFQTVVEEGE
ncbi:MAG: siphovirus ReqiPepy6 Gp37-like family protein [Bacillota bacterium]